MKTSPTHTIVIPIYKMENRITDIINELTRISAKYEINQKEIMLIDESEISLYNSLLDLDE